MSALSPEQANLVEAFAMCAKLPSDVNKWTIFDRASASNLYLIMRIARIQGSPEAEQEAFDIASDVWGVDLGSARETDEYRDRPVQPARKLPGFVYLMRNSSYPGLVKIGCTTRTPEHRRREMSQGPQMLTPFEIIDSYPTDDPLADEQAIHEHLREYRVDSRREFFRIGEMAAVEAVQSLRAGGPLAVSA